MYINYTDIIGLNYLLGTNMWRTRSEALMESLCIEVVRAKFFSALVHDIGRHLHDVMEAKLTALELLMGEELLRFCNGCYKHLLKFIELYSVTEPGARVMKIGGRAGGTTSFVLNVFAV